MMKRASLLWILLLATPISAQEAAPELLREARRLGIRIVANPVRVYPVKTQWGDIAGKPAGGAEVRKYSAVLAAELKIYPAAFLRRTRLKKIILAEGIRFAGQKRAAVPDYQNDWLHLDVKEGGWNKTYQRAVIHHELFHIVDLKDDGQVYEDKEWKKLNPPRFKYGPGGKFARGTDQWPLDPSLSGFLNKYSMSGVEEDKAEIYSHLIIRAKVVYARARKDRVIALKVAAMKALLYRFSRSMDARFWKAVEG